MRWISTFALFYVHKWNRGSEWKFARFCYSVLIPSVGSRRLEVKWAQEKTKRGWWERSAESSPIAYSPPPPAPGAPSSYSCLYYMYFEAPWEKTLSDVGLGKAHAGGQRWCVLSTDGFFWLFYFCCCRLFVCFIFFCCFIDEFGERARVRKKRKNFSSPPSPLFASGQ